MNKIFLTLALSCLSTFAHSVPKLDNNQNNLSYQSINDSSEKNLKQDVKPSAQTINVDDMKIYFITAEEDVAKNVSAQLLAVYLLKIVDVVNSSFDYTSVKDYLAIEMTVDPKHQTFKVGYKKTPNEDEKMIIDDIDKQLKKLPKLRVKKQIKLQILFVIDTQKNFI